MSRQLTCWLALLCLGCGPARLKTYPVSGMVRFADQEPVRSGTIELESLDHGVTATGTIQSDGAFTLGTYRADDGAVAGPHRAIVVQIVVRDGVTQHQQDHGRPVPPRFASYETSPLKLDVSPSQQNQVTVTLPR